MLTSRYLPILTAMIAAIAGMPLDIFQFNQREVGTAKVSPWQTKLSAIVASTTAPLTRFLAFLRSPGAWRVGLAAAMLLLVATGHLHASSGVVFVGLTDTKEIRESINKLGTDMTAITAKCREEKREMTADEERSFDTMDTDREKLLKTEQRLLKVAELEGGEGRRSEPRQPSSEFRQQGGGKKGRDIAAEMDAMRAWITAGSPDAVPPEYQRAAQALGINPFSKFLKLRTPKHVMRSLRQDHQDEWEKRALSTLTATSPEDGSYLIANEMMQPLERARLAFGGVRQAATVKKTTTGAAYPTPTSDDTSNKGALLAENVIAVEKDVEFGQMVLNAFKFTSKKVLVSLELMQDSHEDLAATLGAALGERIGRIENDYFTTGTGSSQPNGIVTAAVSSGTTLAAKTPTYLELVATEGSVDPAYRVGASWMFPDSELQEIKKIVETTTGRPIWLPNMAGGAPDSILGYPYYINQSMDAAAATGSGKSILFGLLSKYMVRDVREIILMRLDELYAEYYQVAFVAFSRSDGDLLDAGTHPVKYTANHS